MIGAISPQTPNLGLEPAGLGDIGNEGQIAPGLTATAIDPLPYIPAPDIGMPSQVDVAITGPAVPIVTGSGGFALNKLSLGRARLDLDDGYWLSLNEFQSEVMIENSNTQMETRIWGAGQVAVNGTDAGQFWGTTSFELANGAKITIETAEDLAKNSYFLDKLTVTKEDRAVIITGVGNEAMGDLTLQQSNDGYNVDDAARDGYVLEEDVASAPTPATIATVPATQTLAAEPDPASLPVEAVIAEETQPVVVVDTAAANILNDLPKPVSAETAPPVIAPAVAVEPVSTIVPVVAEMASVAVDPIIVHAAPAVANVSETPALAVETAPAGPVETPPIATVAQEAAPVATNIGQDGIAPVPEVPKIIGGWKSEWDDPFTRHTLQQETGLGGDYGPNSNLMSLGEVNVFVSSYIVFGHITSLWSLYEMNNSSYALNDVYRERTTTQRLPELELWLLNNPNAQATRA